VLDRLLDVLLVQVLRIWFAKADTAAPAWYRALDHPEVGRALRLLHADPARRWRVDTLAAEVGLSRAAFARQFTARVGVAPLRYLTDWRMGLAAERLRDSDDPIGRIAHAVGYDNEFAFSVAFRRHYGAPPTAFRARLRLAS
jgi:AraC-like DNA-binding protein